MSLYELRMPSLKDKLQEQAEIAELKVEKEDEKRLKRSKIIKKKSKKQ